MQPTNFSQKEIQQKFLETNTATPIEELPLEELSPEVLEMILSCLSFEDMKSSTLVSHLWKDLSLNGAKHRENFLINEFLEFIIDNLDKETYSFQIQELKMCKENKTILTSTTLSLIRKSALELKARILKIFAGIEEKDLIKLEELSKTKNFSKFFACMFIQIKTCKDLILFPHLEDTDKISLIDKLLKENDIYTILYTAKLFFSTYRFSSFLSNITSLIKKDIEPRIFLMVAKAVILDKWKTNVDKLNDLNGLSNKLLEKGETNAAKEIATMMADNKMDNERFVENIITQLLKKDEIDSALKLIETMIEGYSKDLKLEETCKKLLETWEVYKALNVAVKINDNYTRLIKLQDGCIKLAEIGDIRKAKEIAEKLDYLSDKTLNKINHVINTRRYKDQAAKLKSFIFLASTNLSNSIHTIKHIKNCIVIAQKKSHWVNKWVNNFSKIVQDYFDLFPPPEINIRKKTAKCLRHSIDPLELAAGVEGLTKLIQEEMGILNDLEVVSTLSIIASILKEQLSEVEYDAPQKSEQTSLACMKIDSLLQMAVLHHWDKSNSSLKAVVKSLPITSKQRKNIVGKCLDKKNLLFIMDNTLGISLDFIIMHDEDKILKKLKKILGDNLGISKIQVQGNVTITAKWPLIEKYVKGLKSTAFSKHRA